MIKSKEYGAVHLLRFKKIVNEWQHTLDWNTLFWGNHDQPRVVSRFGCTATEKLRVRSAKMLAAAMYLLRGTPFIYQGEEIGMTDYPFACEEELRDVESLNLLREAKKTGKTQWAWNGILKKGRDNARTPMQWDGSANGGFSEGTPWIGVNPGYTRINAAQAEHDPGSILNFYRQLLALRSENDVLRYGDFELLLPEDTQLFTYRRSLGTDSFTVCCNFSSECAAVPDVLSGETVLGEKHEGALPPYGFIVTRERK